MKARTVVLSSFQVLFRTTEALTHVSSWDKLAEVIVGNICIPLGVDYAIVVLPVAIGAAAFTFEYRVNSGHSLFRVVGDVATNASAPPGKSTRISVPLTNPSSAGVAGSLTMFRTKPKRYKSWEQEFLSAAAGLISHACGRLGASAGNRNFPNSITMLLASMHEIFDQMSDMAIVVDPDLNLLWANRSSIQVLKDDFGIDCVMGANLLDMVGGNADLAGHVAASWRDFFAGEPVSESVSIRSITGKICWYEMVYSRFVDTALNSQVGVVICRDITKRREQILQRFAEQYDEAQSIAKIGNWEWDVCNQVFHWSSELYRIMDFDPLVGPPSLTAVLERYHPDDVSILNQATQRMLQDNMPYDFDIRVRQRDGQYRWIQARGRHEVNGTGQLVRMSGTVLDITARKTAELELSRFKLLVESTSDFIGTADLNLQLVYANKSMRNFAGIDEESINDFHVSQLHISTPDQMARMQQLTRELKMTGHCSGEVLWYSADGKDVPIWLKAFTHGDLTGRPLWKSAIARDISELKQVQAELELTKRRLENAQRVAGIGSWEYDTFTGDIWMSESLIEAFSRTQTYQVPIDLDSVIHRFIKEDADLFRDAINRAITLGIGYELDLRLNDETGAERVKRITGDPIKSDDGAVIKLVNTCLDVTEKIRIDEHLRNAEKMEAINRLVGGTAHEFNNMIGIISGSAEIGLEDITCSAGQRGILENIAKTAERAANLTGQLMSVARKQASRPRRIQPNTLLSEWLAALDPDLTGDRVTIETQLSKNAPEIWIDTENLKSVVLGLLRNACEAISNHGIVTITTERFTGDPDSTATDLETWGEYLAITVADTGVGMTPEVKRRLFEPFFTTKDVGRGIGLSLAAIYGIVKVNSGHIDVHSSPGAGSKFTVMLPSVKKFEASAENLINENAWDGKLGDILIIEEDPNQLQSIAEALRRVGFTVIEKTSGPDAMRFLDEFGDQVGLIVTRFVLQGITGAQIARRSLVTQPNRPVAISSSIPRDKLPGDLLECENVYWLEEPLRAQDITSVVGRLSWRPNIPFGSSLPR